MIDLNRREFLKGVAAGPVTVHVGKQQKASASEASSVRPSETRARSQDIAIDAASYFAAGWPLLLAAESGLAPNGTGHLRAVDGERSALAMAEDEALGAIASSSSILTARRNGARLYAVHALPSLKETGTVKRKFLAVWESVLAEPHGVQCVRELIVLIEAGRVLAHKMPDRLRVVLGRKSNPTVNLPSLTESQHDLWRGHCLAIHGNTGFHTIERTAAFRPIRLSLGQRVRASFPMLHSFREAKRNLRPVLYQGSIQGNRVIFLRSNHLC